MKALLIFFALAAHAAVAPSPLRVWTAYLPPGKTVAITLWATVVTGEIPAPAGPGWKLAYVPLGVLQCYRNGLAQTQAIDYTLVGTIIVSPFWHVGDAIICSYLRQ